MCGPLQRQSLIQPTRPTAGLIIKRCATKPCRSPRADSAKSLKKAGIVKRASARENAMERFPTRLHADQYMRWEAGGGRREEEGGRREEGACAWKWGLGSWELGVGSWE